MILNLPPFENKTKTKQNKIYIYKKCRPISYYEWYRHDHFIWSQALSFHRFRHFPPLHTETTECSGILWPYRNTVPRKRYTEFYRHSVIPASLISFTDIASYRQTLISFTDIASYRQTLISFTDIASYRQTLISFTDIASYRQTLISFTDIASYRQTLISFTDIASYRQTLIETSTPEWVDITMHFNGVPLQC